MNPTVLWYGHRCHLLFDSHHLVDMLFKENKSSNWLVFQQFKTFVMIGSWRGTTRHCTKQRRVLTCRAITHSKQNTKKSSNDNIYKESINYVKLTSFSKKNAITWWIWGRRGWRGRRATRRSPSWPDYSWTRLRLKSCSLTILTCHV